MSTYLDPHSSEAWGLLSTLSSFGLFRLPTDHTRVTSLSASTIDLLFASNPAMV